MVEPQKTLEVKVALKKAFKNLKSESRSVVSDSLWPHGLYSPWNSPGQNAGVGSHRSLLQGSSQPRDRTQVSHIAGRFFTSWATREGPKRHYAQWNKLSQKNKHWFYLDAVPRGVSFIETDSRMGVGRAEEVAEVGEVSV